MATAVDKPAVVSSPWARIAIAVTLGGVSPVLAKYLLRSMSLEGLLIWRYGLSVAFLLPLVTANFRPRRRSPGVARVPPITYASLACVAVLGSGVGAVLFTASLKYAPAAVSNGLSKAGPLFVAFLAHLLLNESVTVGALGLLVAMLLGAGMLSAGEAAGAAPAAIPLLGATLAGAAGLTRAVAEVAAKSALTSWSPFLVAAARFAGGAVIAAGLGLARPDALHSLPSSASEWIALFALAWLCTALPVALYYSAVARLPVHVATGVRTTGAAVTAVVSWVALAEALNVYHLVGIAALLLAAYAMASLPLRPAVPRRPASRGLVRPMLQFVAIVVAASVLITGFLQAWQLQALLRRQIQSTLARTAALIGELVAVGEPVPPTALADFARRVVRETIDTPGYTAEFAYIVIGDAGGLPVAWAFRDAGHGEAGRLRAQDILRRRGGPPNHDLVPAHVIVRSHGLHVADVYIGYRASIAWGPLLAIIARTTLLAAVLALVASVMAASLVRSALAPIAAEAARLRSELLRVSPSGSAGLEQIAATALAEWLESGRTVILSAPPHAAVCWAQPAAPASAASWLAEAIGQLDETDGTIAGAADGWLLCAWGGQRMEEDDPIRAWMWAASLPPGPRLLTVVHGGYEEAVASLRRLYDKLADAQSRGASILADGRYASAVAGRHLHLTRIAEDLYAVVEASTEEP